MKVTVTEEDIALGLPNNRWQCPIACAIKRSKKDVSIVSVSTLDMRVNNHWYILPSVARSFIRQFDAGGAVEPFEFEARAM